MLVRKTRLPEISIFFFSGMGATFFIALILTLIYFTLEHLQANGLTSLFAPSWSPEESEFGIAPMVYGTAVSTAIALILAVPLGILSGFALSFSFSGRYRLKIKAVLELLSGIPSIVYGLLGVGFFTLFLENLFDLTTGRTILAAGLILGIMILPMLITFTEDALSEVPSAFKENGLALGLTDLEIARRIYFPIVRPRLKSAVLVSFGRAMGETMAVMLIIGSIDRIPSPWFDVLKPGQTFTSKLGREIAEVAFHSSSFNALLTMATLLMALVSLVNFLSFIRLKPKEGD